MAGEEFTETIEVPDFDYKRLAGFTQTVWDDFRPGHTGYLLFVGGSCLWNGGDATWRVELTFRPLASIPQIGGKPQFRYVGNPLAEPTRI